MPAFIVVDAREAAVADAIAGAWAGRRPGAPPFAVVRQQIPVGDFLVCRDAAVLACFERKTLRDFGASMADGRIDNVQKMLDLRRRTGCRLFLVVEGPAFPAPTTRFARVPYAAIRETCVRLAVAHDVHVVVSRNADDTAALLGLYARMLDAEMPVTGGDAKATPAADTPATKSAATSATDMPADMPTAPPAALQVTDLDRQTVVAKMWSRVGGISYSAGKRIYDAGFSVADVAGGALPPSAIVGRNAARALAALAGRRDPEAGRAASAQLLAGVQGVSLAVARAVVGAAGSLGAVLAMSEGALADVVVSPGARAPRLGPARAGRIVRIFRMKGGA